MQDIAKIKNEYNKVTHNEDGNLSIQIFSEPIEAQLPDGSWIPIDVNIDPLTLSPKAIPFKVKFDSKLTNPDAVTVESLNNNVKFKLNKYGLDGYEELQLSGDAVVSNNSITYSTAWGRIVYEILNLGIKETIYIERDVLQDPTTLGLDLSNLVVNIDFGLAPGPFESSLVAWDVMNRPVEVHRSNTGITIPYTSYVGAKLPLVIDPTLETSSGSGYYFYHYSTPGVWTISIAPKYGTESNPFISGDTINSVPDTPADNFRNRASATYPLTLYVNHTIYGECRYRINFAAYDAGSPITYEIPYESFGGWDAVELFSLGTVPNTGDVYSVDLKSRIILCKSGISQSSKVFTVQTVGFETLDDTIDRRAGVLSTRTLEFSSYSTFIQNAPDVSVSGSANITWVNGGGLVAGDKHRIYYALGAGLSEDAIIAGGMSVESTDYTDTSAIVNGLNSGETYSFLVVDLQLIDGVFYEGARSNVQSATVAIVYTGISVTALTATSTSLANASIITISSDLSLTALCPTQTTQVQTPLLNIGLNLVGLNSIISSQTIIAELITTSNLNLICSPISLTTLSRTPDSNISLILVAQSSAVLTFANPSILETTRNVLLAGSTSRISLSAKSSNVNLGLGLSIKGATAILSVGSFASNLKSIQNLNLTCSNLLLITDSNISSLALGTGLNLTGLTSELATQCIPVLVTVGKGLNLSVLTSTLNTSSIISNIAIIKDLSLVCTISNTDTESYISAFSFSDIMLFCIALTLSATAEQTSMAIRSLKDAIDLLGSLDIDISLDTDLNQCLEINLTAKIQCLDVNLLGSF